MPRLPKDPYHAPSLSDFVITLQALVQTHARTTANAGKWHSKGTP